MKDSFSPERFSDFDASYREVSPGIFGNSAMGRCYAGRVQASSDLAGAHTSLKDTLPKVVLRSSNDTTAVSPTTPANEDSEKRSWIRMKRMIEQVILTMWMLLMMMMMMMMVMTRRRMVMMLLLIMMMMSEHAAYENINYHHRRLHHQISHGKDGPRRCCWRRDGDGNGIGNGALCVCC